MYIKQFADKTRFFKETPEGVSQMCKAIEDMRNEAAREAETIKSIQIAINLIETGDDSFEKIARVCGLTLEEVQELAAEVNTPA
jgi:predicted HTH domain antitoxin